MWSLRTTPCTVTKTSPYFQVYGMQLQLLSDFSLGSHVEDNTQREETHVQARLAATQISTLKAVQKRHDQNQKQYARKVKVKYYKPENWWISGGHMTSKVLKNSVGILKILTNYYLMLF